MVFRTTTKFNLSIYLCMIFIRETWLKLNRFGHICQMSHRIINNIKEHRMCFSLLDLQTPKYERQKIFRTIQTSCFIQISCIYTQTYLYMHSYMYACVEILAVHAETISKLCQKYLKLLVIFINVQSNDGFQEIKTSQLLLSLMMLLRNHLELRNLIRSLSCVLF